MAPTQDEQRTAGLIRPSDKTISFAIIIVQTKPPELSVGEYIRLLRLHIAQGRRRDAISSTNRHLDRTSYWKSEHKRVAESLKLVEDENVDLRREIESLKSKLDVPKASTSPNKKRKKQEEEPVPSQPPRKKSKIVALPVKVIDIEHSSEDAFSDSGGTGKALLRDVYRIQTTLKRQNVNTSELGYYLEQTSDRIAKIIQGEIELLLKTSDPDLDRLKTTCCAVTRCIVSIFIAFKRIGTNDEEAACHGRVVYAIVRMFKKLLSGIRTLSASQIDALTDSESAGTSSAAARSSKGKEKTSKTPATKESAALSTVTAFLGDIVQLLDGKVEVNKPIFEGFAYCTFTRLGSRLFSSTFGHARALALEDEITQGMDEDEREKKQVEVEAPYLVHLLHRVMMAAPAHLGSARTKLGKTKVVMKGNPKDALASTGKECLQRTLVNSIFGTEGVDQDDPFMDCLKMPSAGGGPIAMPKGKDVDVEEWYKEEVWRLLGWEILEREDGLPAIAGGS